MLFNTAGASAPAPLAAPPTPTIFSSPADTSNKSSSIKPSSAINIPMNPPPTPHTSSATMSNPIPHPPFNPKTPSTPFTSNPASNCSSTSSTALSSWPQSTTSTPATSPSPWPSPPADPKPVVPVPATTTDIFTGLNSSPTSSTAAQFYLLPKAEQRDIIQCADYLLTLAAGASPHKTVPAVPKPQKRKATAEPTERTTKRARAADGRLSATQTQNQKRDDEPAAPVQEEYSLKAAGALLREARNGYTLNRLEVGLRRCVMAELMREVRNEHRVRGLERRIRREKRKARWGAVKGRVWWNGEVYEL